MSDIRETFALQQKLDAGLDEKRRYFYQDVLNNNLRLDFKLKDRDRRFDLINSKEFNVTDWYILYALLILRVADVDTVKRLLVVIKRKNPQLAVNAEFTYVRTRITWLAKNGFIAKLQYVQNTSVSAAEAYEYFDELSKQSEEADDAILSLDAEEIVSLEDEMNGTSQWNGNLTYSDFDMTYIDAIRRKNAIYKRNQSTGGIYGGDYATYFGKDSYLVNCYMLNDSVYNMLCARFGNGVVMQIGNLSVKMSYELIGIAAAGLVTAALYELPSFYKTKESYIKSKYRNFTCLSESEFRMNGSSDQRYFGAVFASYNYCDKSKVLPEMEKKKLYDTVVCIKNYLGIKGIGKSGKDAFAIVCVNDMADLMRFVDACMNYGLTELESERIYFTGEGILRSEIGISKLIRLRLTDAADTGYQFEPAVLPVMA